MEVVADPPALATSTPRARRSPIWIGALALVIAVAATLAFWATRAARPVYVTAAVTRGNIQRMVNMTGALNPVVTVQVGSYVSGTIKSLGCDYNTEVVVGQVCATIDPLPFQLIVDQDRAVVSTGLAQLKKDQAALVYAKLVYERDAKLLKDNSVSQDTVDSEESNYEQGVAQVALDKASNADKVAILKAAEVNLAYTNIVSPVVGTVITRAIDVGQTVAASLSSPTLFIIGKDLTQMQVDTNVSEADIGEVKLGQEAWFSVQAFAGKTYRGKVSQIRRGPITVQNVVTYDVVIAVANPDRALLPGMTADTHIVIDEHDDVLRVPLPAIRFNPEGVARAHEHEESGASPRRDDELANAVAGNDAASDGAERKRDRPRGDGEHRGNRAEWAKRRAEREAAQADGGSALALSDSGKVDEKKGRAGGKHERGEHKAQIWVMSDGALHAVRVNVGLDDGALVEIVSEEIKPGDLVVVNEAGAAEHRAAAPAPGANAFRQGGQGGPRL